VVLKDQVGLEIIVSKTVIVNGFNTHYYEGGQGEPLIIIHGGGEGAGAWKHNIQVLAKNYHVFAPDLPGFGLSLTDLDSYAIPAVAEFVNQFSEAIGLSQFNLLGHSFGGGIVAHVALKYPHKVRKLVLVSSLCLGKEIAWWVRLSSVGHFNQICGKSILGLYQGAKYLVNLFSDAVIRQPFSTASVQIGTEITNYARQTIVLQARLPGLLAPTLVIWGANDPIVPPEHAYQAGKLIPDCRVKVFANCGHSVYRENLKGFSTELAGFLG
jgi:pimeloyl-ACP methyl ester carboxylesterase